MKPTRSILELNQATNQAFSSPHRSTAILSIQMRLKLLYHDVDIIERSSMAENTQDKPQMTGERLNLSRLENVSSHAQAWARHLVGWLESSCPTALKNRPISLLSPLNDPCGPQRWSSADSRPVTVTVEGGTSLRSPLVFPDAKVAWVLEALR